MIANILAMRDKKKVAIIGAGIAGLTLANFLKKYSDHEFVLYEKQENLSLDEGYGIQLAANSIKILNQINNMKKFNLDTNSLIISLQGILKNET